MDNEVLDRMLAEGITALKQLKIPVPQRIVPHVKVNTRAQKRLGCCICRDGVYTIEVSAGLLEDREKAGLLQQTLYHELLHTCPGCANHGEAWKRYAALVNRAYGCEIARTVDIAEKQEMPAFSYILYCETCHTEIGRYRMSKAVKYPHLYRCSKCGGKLSRIK